MNTAVHDVAIVGYGPAGATLANLLGQAGLSVLVIDREAGIYPLPRAIHFDGEVMRVFQSIGLRAQVEAIARAGLEGMHFVDAQGETLMVRGGTSAHGPHGCATNYYFHQPQLEAVLRQGVARFAAVRVLLQHEVSAVHEEDQRVALDLADRVSGARSRVHARWVVGCDGARSLVRRTLGARMLDLGLQQDWLVFDMLLKDGAPQLPTYSVQHCDPERPKTWCNVTGRRRRWEIMVLPQDDRERIVEPEALWPLVSRWLKPEDAEIERAAIYTFRSQIAQGWRRGRLMIAGDAAHLTPPFLGQGMCAAIRDASNLAWKLVAVARGTADAALLDTYESERAPHVRAFIELAVRLGNIIQTLDPEEARSRDARLRAQPENFTFPAPRLGAGAWRGGHAVVARPFPQPRLGDGTLLDERVGNRCAVVGTERFLGSIPEPLKQSWHASGLVLLDAGNNAALASWLKEADAQAVVVRPDRYVAGLVQDAAELASMIAVLQGAAATVQAAVPA